MIVTIDGPAGAGKSSVARALARRLDFDFLDTGAMYRAVALAGMRHGVAWNDRLQLAELAKRVTIGFCGDRVLLDGEDVTEALRTSALTAHIRYAADNPQVRLHLVQLQRQIAEGMDLVTEGRDQGTLVFPQAECKFFLTASPQERARRRVAQLQAGGQPASCEEVLAQQQARDDEDSGRELGALAKAADAVEVITDGMSLDQVVDHLEQIVRQRQAASKAESPDPGRGIAQRRRAP